MLDTIHQTSMKILGQTGIRIDDEKILGLLAAKGVKQDGNIAYFTEVQIQDALSTVPKEFILHGRNPKFAPCIGGDKTHYLGSFGAPYILKVRQGRAKLTSRYFYLFLPNT